MKHLLVYVHDFRQPLCGAENDHQNVAKLSRVECASCSVLADTLFEKGLATLDSKGRMKTPFAWPYAPDTSERTMRSVLKMLWPQERIDSLVYGDNPLMLGLSAWLPAADAEPLFGTRAPLFVNPRDYAILERDLKAFK